MPTIEAYADHPTHPYVRVQATWADLPQVTQAAVYRVDAITGECTPLRPYICYDGWELLLSCGHGTWWDTEAPFDREFYYITTSTQAPCTPAAAAVISTFSTPVVGNWGVADTGQVWNQVLDPGNVASVSGGVANSLVDTAGESSFFYIQSSGTGVRLQAQFRTPATATGDIINFELIPRFTDLSNYISVQILLLTTGFFEIRFARRLAGVGALVGPTVAAGPYTPNVFINAVVESNGDSYSAKAWSAAGAEPEWLTQITNTEFPLGPYYAVRVNRGNTNTNVGTTFNIDNFMATLLCAPCDPVTVDTSSDPITLVSDGRFWLKDPVRPCHDRPVPLCPTDTPRQPNCGGGSGILFVGTGPEIYPANSLSLRPMNRRRTLSATRPRGDAVSALRLQTTTFVDRDDLLQLAAPGSPLLWQGPAEYGISDRYMDVKDVQVSPELPDLRIQVRTETLPYDVQERPAGPSQGICGARVADICAEYRTWGDLAATGMTWDDLVAGQASPASANPDARTWTDVNNDFASWNAVNTGGRTWQGLQEGD